MSQRNVSITFLVRGGLPEMTAPPHPPNRSADERAEDGEGVTVGRFLVIARLQFGDAENFVVENFRCMEPFDEIIDQICQFVD